MVDLPAPIMPTSTTERLPRADVMSASWVGLVCAGAAVSDIKNSAVLRDLLRAATPILPPSMPLPETLATGMGTCWMISLVNSSP